MGEIKLPHLDKPNMAKVLVGNVSEIPEGKMTHITAGGKEILVANISGSFYAMSDTCTHAGAELHEGELQGKELTCPWHGAKWDVTTGGLNWFPQKLNALSIYRVSVENGMIYVDM